MARRSSSIGAPLLLLSAMLAASAAVAQAPDTDVGTPAQIIAQARADLTPAGEAWANAEAQRIRQGGVQHSDVEKDAASVTGGVNDGGTPDDLVLIALVNARDAASRAQRDAGASGLASLNQHIGNVIQTLTDTQRPAPRKKID
jgi:hypothetical protein